MDGTMADLLAPPPYLHSKAQMKAANVSEEGQESAVRAMLERPLPASRRCRCIPLEDRPAAGSGAATG